MAEAMRRAERRERWRALVEAWRCSGSSKAAFCREREVNAGRFHYWCRALSEERSTAGDFARVAPAGVAGAGLRLRLGGLELEIEPGFDEATFRRVLRLLGAPC